MRRIALCLFLLLTACASTHGAADNADVERAVQGFLTAFENLDWESFHRFFADDATVFFPAPEPPQRFTGRQEVETHFQEVFRGIRQSSKATAPPYMHLVPADLRVDRLGPDAAIVTFMMVNGSHVSRRTFVMRRERDGWRIVHLHASNGTK
jgi:ketosteroid isomerase-like protein